MSIANQNDILQDVLDMNALLSKLKTILLEVSAMKYIIYKLKKEICLFRRTISTSASTISMGRGRRLNRVRRRSPEKMLS